MKFNLGFAAFLACFGLLIAYLSPFDLTNDTANAIVFLLFALAILALYSIFKKIARDARNYAIRKQADAQLQIVIQSENARAARYQAAILDRSGN
jgi:archaellum biogenesis protein FlaJ (TadC family)